MLGDRHAHDHLQELLAVEGLAARLLDCALGQWYDLVSIRIARDEKLVRLRIRVSGRVRVSLPYAEAEA